MTQDVELHHVNFRKYDINHHVMGDAYTTNVEQIPRIPFRQYRPPPAQKDPWTFAISIFKDYKMDTPVRLYSL
jgi:hypothetical protein